MKQILVPTVLASDSLTIRRKRELPASGKVLVGVGDTVEPNTVVANTSIQSGVFVVRVTQLLGLEPNEIEGISLVKEGEVVSEGDVLAKHHGLFGLFTSEIKSPVSGTVEYLSSLTGHIGIRLPSKELSLAAYLHGTVTEILSNRGVVIESHCACVQGIFGVGGERTGVLKEIPVKPDELIRVTSFPDQLEGSILFGGAGIGYGALKHAAQKGARAIVTGSIDDQTLHSYLGYQLGIAITGNEKVPLTLIMTEGFGAIPMNEKALMILKKYSGCAASVNGATQVRAGAVRPEILIFSDKIQQQKTADQQMGLEVGATVRLIRHPYFGKMGTVSDLPQKLQALETGSLARVVAVKLHNDEIVTVPRANVEVM